VLAELRFNCDHCPTASGEEVDLSLERSFVEDEIGKLNFEQAHASRAKSVSEGQPRQ
jgi:hypothetical protein